MIGKTLVEDLEKDSVSTNSNWHTSWLNAGHDKSLESKTCRAAHDFAPEDPIASDLC